MSADPTAQPTLTTAGRYFVLAGAFFGWLFAGMQMTTMQLASGAATHEYYHAGKLVPDGSLNGMGLFGRTGRAELPAPNTETAAADPALAQAAVEYAQSCRFTADPKRAKEPGSAVIGRVLLK